MILHIARIINDDTLENKEETCGSLPGLCLKCMKHRDLFLDNSRQYVDKKKSDHGYDFI
jgi:hypothetical protein